MDMKIEFNHGAEIVSASLSIPNKRAQFLLDESHVAYIRTDDIGRAMEMAMFYTKPQSAAEVIFIGYCIGKLNTKP